MLLCSAAGPVAASLRATSGATFDIIREREEPEAEREEEEEGIKDNLSFSGYYVCPSGYKNRDDDREENERVNDETWFAPTHETTKRRERRRGKRVVLLTSATIMLATIYNTAHRGKTASVRRTVTEGQPDTNRAVCFECLAPD